MIRQPANVQAEQPSPVHKAAGRRPVSSKRLGIQKIPDRVSRVRSIYQKPPPLPVSPSSSAGRRYSRSWETFLFRSDRITVTMIVAGIATTSQLLIRLKIKGRKSHQLGFWHCRRRKELTTKIVRNRNICMPIKSHKNQEDAV